MIEIIPAIDIIGGKCVRLEQGNYGKQSIYDEDPLEVAGRYMNAGIRRLHLVDLDGARQGRVVNLEILEKIAGGTDLIIDFGGGIKTTEDVRKVLGSGAGMVTAGSIAVRDPELVKHWLREFGRDRIILGADVRKGKIAISGWEESSDRELFEFIREYMREGIHRLICTEISRDGMLEGPALDLYLELVTAFPDVEVIASGGVTEISDIDELERTGVAGVIIGKALFEGRIRMEDLVRFYISGTGP